MKQNQNRQTGRAKAVIRTVMAVITVILGIGMLVSGYAGEINPESFRAAGLFVLTLSIWFYALVVMIVIDVFFARKAALAGVVFMLAGMPAVLDFCPLNFGVRKAPEGSREIKFMTYNVMGFYAHDGEYPGDANPTVSYLLDSGADIICIQEAGIISQNPSIHITAQQVDSLHAIYPYIFKSGSAQAILSKYPVEPVRTDFRYKQVGGFDLGVFRGNVDGCKITIFNVHLKSMNLTLDDREVYTDFTRFKGDENLKDIKRRILSKVVSAGVVRAKDMTALMKYISHYGGPNVIVCGDFNDVAWSYSVNTVEKAGFKQVYREVGLGPMITYNSNDMFFRIDHILYRGCLEPLSVSRGSLKSSDHYPVKASFIINKNNKK